MEYKTEMPAQLFGKNRLVYAYKWDLRHEAGIKRKKTLDRTNGYEVLHFINSFFKKYELTSHITFKRAEYLMYNHLPININSKNEITSWLLKHWDNEYYI